MRTKFKTIVLYHLVIYWIKLVSATANGEIRAPLTFQEWSESYYEIVSNTPTYEPSLSSNPSFSYIPTNVPKEISIETTKPTRKRHSTLVPTISVSLNQPSSTPSVESTNSSVDQITNNESINAAVSTIILVDDYYGPIVQSATYKPTPTPKPQISVVPSIEPTSSKDQFSTPPSDMPSFRPVNPGYYYSDPTNIPTEGPSTNVPTTISPTISFRPTRKRRPTFAPYSSLSHSPFISPSVAPSIEPTIVNTFTPSSPTVKPSGGPTVNPSLSLNPTLSYRPTKKPSSFIPTIVPSLKPTRKRRPTLVPVISISPSVIFTAEPTSTQDPNLPTYKPSISGTYRPSRPTLLPSYQPSLSFTYYPLYHYSSTPTLS